MDDKFKHAYELSKNRGKAFMLEAGIDRAAFHTLGLKADRDTRRIQKAITAIRNLKREPDQTRARLLSNSRKWWRRMADAALRSDELRQN